MKKVMKWMLVALTSGSIFGFNRTIAQAEEKQVVKIGIRSSGIDMVESFRNSVEDAGFIIEETVFDDAVQPNIALDQGTVDINLFQHEVYMEAFNENNSTELVMVEPTVYYGKFSLYSEKYDSIDQMPDNAKIGISNDPSNQDRALRFLSDLGVIKVDEKVEVLTILDITENPKNIEFVTANNSLLPQSLTDLDYIICAATHMKNAGKDFRNSIEESKDGFQYRVGFVVNKKDLEEEWVNKFVDAALCKEFYEYLSERGTEEPLFEFDDKGERILKDIQPENLGEEETSSAQ